jgi:hypothetical protein
MLKSKKGCHYSVISEFSAVTLLVDLSGKGTLSEKSRWWGGYEKITVYHEGVLVEEGKRGGR